MPREYSYDPECKKLAEHFIADSTVDPRLTPDLAEHIQTAVEEWFAADWKVKE